MGDEWGVDLLRPGQCVTVWKEEGKPKSPKEVDCEVVGERLERSGSEKFWDSDFEIYFNDISLGVCQKRAQTCELRFIIFP
jgi:hypothetical protein